jgi:hypothetical protein
MNPIPQVGDIWYNKSNKYHYLVLQDDYRMGMYGDCGYTMLILEQGIVDHAYLPHFRVHCYFVQ